MDELLNERRKSFEAVIEMEDGDLILMKNEGIFSQRGNLMNLINVTDEEQMQENTNADDGARIALEEGLHRDSKAKCIEEEGHLLKDVKKEEAYAKDLAKGERTSDDWLYRKLDFQRRKLEKQRTYTWDKLLKKGKQRNCHE